MKQLAVALVATLCFNVAATTANDDDEFDFPVARGHSDGDVAEGSIDRRRKLGERQR